MKIDLHTEVMIIMRIAICDNDSEEIQRLIALFNEYKNSRNIQLIFHTFTNNPDLLSHLKSDEYDLLLLELLTPSISAVETVKEIRALNKNIKILILSASSAFAVDSYLIGAYYYLLKPATEKSLFPLLDQLNIELSLQEENALLIKNREKVMRIPFSKTEYIEVMNKTVSFHLTDGSVRDSSGALSDFEDDVLSRPEFLKIHRSYIANLAHIQSLNAKGATTRTGHMIPVSRSMYAQVKDAYIHYLFKSGSVAEPPLSPEPIPPEPEPPAPPIKERIRGTYHLLFVDDEADQLSYWGGILQAHGCVVHTALSAEEALEMAPLFSFDCVLLDVMLADGNSYSLCQQLTELTEAPVIFLSCNTDADSQLKGFRSGAIDYLTKDTPSSLFWTKVETRIRLSQPESVVLELGPLVLDLSLRKLYLDQEDVPLTSTEFDILHLLGENSTHVYTPDELYHAIWGTALEGTQTVQVHMSRLRRKLEKACPDHSFIETIWGEGYHFIPYDLAPPEGDKEDLGEEDKA